jgi:NADPH:quinone reductase-like Zn-dependent oxidoreductase
MKALVLDKPGSPKTLRATEVPRPEPGEGEVRVRVHAVGLNPVDYKLAASGFPGWDYPFILGLDVAGVVEAVGPDVTEWEEGDRIFYHGNLLKPGGYAQYAIAPSHVLSWIPEGITYVQAAALPCAGFTAYQALNRKLHIQSGRSILIHGGAGGVGGFAVQLARAAGLKIAATCSSHNFKFVQRLGADEVIDYRSEDLAGRVSEFTQGRGVDYILDTVGPESATESLDLLAFGGQIACVAGLPDITRLRPFEKGISIHEVSIGGAYRSGDVNAQEDLAKIGREFGALVGKGMISPMLEQTISLEEIPEALIRLSMRHVRGKIVAEVL